MKLAFGWRTGNWVHFREIFRIFEFEAGLIGWMAVVSFCPGVVVSSNFAVIVPIFVRKMSPGRSFPVLP